MRPILFTSCLLATSIAVSGCRQTNGSTAGGPLQQVSPFAPSGLAPAPIAARTASAITPLGAPTRVPPPPNTSFQNSANAPSGFVPYGATNTPAFDTRNEGFVSAEPVGSGVSQAGWTETNSFGTTGTIGPIQPDTPPAVRFGGMQVNDLTGIVAPAPVLAPTPTPLPAQTIPQHIIPQQLIPQQSLGFKPYAPQPIAIASNNAFQSAPSILEHAAPSINEPRFEGAERFESRPSTQTAKASNIPSTEPTSSDSTLRWRRPGTSY